MTLTDIDIARAKREAGPMGGSYLSTRRALQAEADEDLKGILRDNLGTIYKSLKPPARKALGILLRLEPNPEPATIDEAEAEATWIEQWGQRLVREAVAEARR